jgi:hypothetical protein
MPSLAVPLTFATLQRRLLLHVRGLLANGELTERGLARLIGLSQPHIHNVLKGARVLTPDVGDLLAAALGVSLLDLAGSEELGSALESRSKGSTEVRLVRFASGRITPRERFPDFSAGSEWLALPSDAVSAAARPALTGFDPDAEIAFVFRGATHALLDLDDRARLAVRDGCWYALRWGGAGFVRQLRRENGTLLVLGQRTWISSPLPDRIPLGDLPALTVVRARLVWAGRDPRRAALALQDGEFFPAATDS